jgi:hypothetical protein
MTNTQKIENVRQSLQQWFAAHCEPAELQFEESILIRNGFYCGRKFHFNKFSAVWFLEENQLKIFDEEGVLRSTAVLDEACKMPVGTSRMAA